eukprot:NODE_958_length_1093_cov_63.995859_g914_i0.p1 GENE.NODE_958_length_1093_cov_63.995859_g914_i0~~NODE_958_length_1093_cov_63.995859_g914_i0.p1  ORF type:complete len:308 (+),score=71.00 NODE_958_length_1093_cov_63.995859_g914_i0:75-998(+)
MSKPQVDQAKAMGYETAPQAVAYNKRDLLLYAKGVGETDLRYTYENTPGFSALPTYPVVLGLKGDSQDIVPFGVSKKKSDKKSADVTRGIPGIPKYDPNMILHGEQSIEILNPLPLEGNFQLKGKIIGVYDKGKGMLMQSESTMVDANGKAYCKLVSGTFIRGLGGFGGIKQPKEVVYKPPKRNPDFVEEFKTSPDQAQLYRLSGDYNPLHVDPAVAKKVGFPAPILHGLCSLGIAGRAVLKHCCNYDASRFRSLKVRFATPVFPGETLVTEMWKEEGKIIFQTKVKERNVICISNAVAEVAPASKL